MFKENLSANCKLTTEVERRSKPRRTLTLPLKVYSLSKWHIVTNNIYNNKGFGRRKENSFWVAIQRISDSKTLFTR